MSHDKYIREDFNSQLGHIIEECGEAIAAAGKIVRFGPLSVNPELPPEKREANIDWLKRELTDVKTAIERFEKGFL